MHHLLDLELMPRLAAIFAALEPDRDWLARPVWLRFAARAAVLCPFPPEETARRIRLAAEALRHGGGWLSDLASPWRFVLAALLVQDGVEAADFLASLPGDQDRLRAAGVRPGGMYETMAIAILRHLGGGGLSDERIGRMRQLHDGLKRHHWWLTGPDDLPVCACLTAAPLPVAAASARIESNHAGLRAGGFARGNHLLRAACLLVLPDLPEGAALARFLALARAFASHRARLWHEDYEAVALLSLLGHDPDLVVERVAACLGELEAQEPGLRGQATFNLAADLALLDLARCDGRGSRLAHGADPGPALELLHLAAAGTLLLSTAADSIATSELAGWPPPPALYPPGGMLP
jgi:hypothetical protein